MPSTRTVYLAGRLITLDADLPSAVWDHHWTTHESGGLYRTGPSHRTLHLRREIWAYYHGEIPEGHDIHNQNGNPDDLRVTNLAARLPDDRQRRCTLTQPPRGGQYKGVSQIGGVYRARLASRHLGCYPTPELAAAAYNGAVRAAYPGLPAYLNPV